MRAAARLASTPTLNPLQCLFYHIHAGKPSCLTCPPFKSHQPCTSDSVLRQPQTPAMTHIANCMRLDPNQTSSVYITLETSSTTMVRLPAPLSVSMNYHLPRRSRSLRDLQATQDSNLPLLVQTKSPPLAAPAQPTPSKYHLWLSAKSPGHSSKSSHSSSDRLTALAAGRSPTSLSDTAVLSENSLPFWQRTGSLSRRRKVSVPELGTTMTTVQEMPLDSRKLILYSTRHSKYSPS